MWPKNVALLAVLLLFQTQLCVCFTRSASAALVCMFTRPRETFIAPQWWLTRFDCGCCDWTQCPPRWVKAESTSSEESSSTADLCPTTSATRSWRWPTTGSGRASFPDSSASPTAACPKSCAGTRRRVLSDPEPSEAANPRYGSKEEDVTPTLKTGLSDLVTSN